MKYAKTVSQRATNNVPKDIPCESQIPMRRNGLDSESLKQMSKSYLLFEAISRKKVHAKVEKIDKIMYGIVCDKSKVRSLKEALRSKGIVTNMAIQQCLIREKSRYCKTEQDSNICISKNISISSLGSHEPHVTITKENIDVSVRIQLLHHL